MSSTNTRAACGHKRNNSESSPQQCMRTGGGSRAMNFIYTRTERRLTFPSDFLYASKIRHTSSGPAEAVCLPISKCCVIGLLSMGFWGTMGLLLNLENIFAAGILHFFERSGWREKDVDKRKNKNIYKWAITENQHFCSNSGISWQGR